MEFFAIPVWRLKRLFSAVLTNHIFIETRYYYIVTLFYISAATTPAAHLHLSDRAEARSDARTVVLLLAGAHCVEKVRLGVV
jgi:hypothetical protein